MLEAVRKIAAATVMVAALSVSAGVAVASEAGKIRMTAGSSDLHAMWVELARKYEELHPGIEVDLDNTSRSYDDLVQSTLRDVLTNSLPQATALAT